jgi:hypothetical protein
LCVTTHRVSVTSGGARTNWPERSACDQQSNLGRPLFLALIPEGVVVGIQNFAWAPNSQKFEDSNREKHLHEQKFFSDLHYIFGALNVQV